MEIPKWVDAYLTATRMHSLAKVTSDSFERLKSLMERLRSSDPEVPSLIVTYSYTAFPEVIGNGRETYIIYDLFLTDCAQGLIHLLRSLPDESAVHSFCQNIIVKKLIQAKAPHSLILFLDQTASKLSEICAITKPDNSWESEFPDLSKAFLIQVQEAYATYHEIAHYLLGRDDAVHRKMRKTSFEMARQDIRHAVEFSAKQKKLVLDMEGLQQKLSWLFDEPESLVNDLMNGSNPNDLDQLNELLERAFQGRFEERAEKVQWLVEEVACDHLATVMTFFELNKDSIPTIVPWREFSASLHVAFMNLSVLRRLSRYAKLLVDRNPTIIIKPDDMANEIRGVVLRQTIRRQLPLLPNKQGIQWEDVERYTREMAIRYDKMLWRYVFFEMSSYVKKVLKVTVDW